jgi:hypothetical protein
MSEPKEVSFFQDVMDFQPNPNYEKGWDWYQQAFTHYNGEQVIGEATPSYSDRSRSPNTARRIYDFNPEMKIVYMVRNPLERQISAWKMQWYDGMDGLWPNRRENLWALAGFDYWMKMQFSVMQWDICRYGYQLSAYENLFSSENICVSFLEDWRQNKQKEVERIMIFLGLDPLLWNPQNAEYANRGEDRKVQRSLFKKIRMTKPAMNISRYFPSSWRERFHRAMPLKYVSPPVPKLSPTLKDAFIAYVYEDSTSFLRRYGKDIDLWNRSLEGSKSL